ncbi:hypothetical protein BDW59DRAFT_160883 [Aspergillus cavernicola]|uniref:Uncharacterized protein n=1 Tax=Aspergillus cavernicola TaxID=176166 RepID=A0ABR4IG30_9EURO
MTQTPPHQVDSRHEVQPGPEINDTEMPDANIPRGGLDKGPDIPPRKNHPDAHAAAISAVSAMTDASQKFKTMFWNKSRPEMKPSYPSCPSQPPQPPPHQQPHELPAEQHPLPETPAATTTENQVPQYQDEEALSIHMELELRRKIEELEAELADVPSPEFVLELQRTLEIETAERQKDRERAQQDIRQKNSELDVLRKRWKQAARELDKSRSQSQGFYQVTDNYLIELTTRLRYNIRNFAIQYFGGELKGKPKVGDKPKCWDPYMATTTPGNLDCEAFLLSERRPNAIQAFLWRFIVYQIFDNFRWAGENGITLRHLCLALRPEGQYPDSDEPVVPEEERKFQMWLSSTTAMILDGGKARGKSRSLTTQVETEVKSLVEKVREVIDPFVALKDLGYPQELNRIMEEAIELDTEISRQVARVEWVFPKPAQEVPFDSTIMRLGTAEMLPKEKEKQMVRLVICPAMKKRGKSTGEDFQSESLLVPMEVSCEPASTAETRSRR